MNAFTLVPGHVEEVLADRAHSTTSLLLCLLYHSRSALAIHECSNTNVAYTLTCLLIHLSSGEAVNLSRQPRQEPIINTLANP